MRLKVENVTSGKRAPNYGVYLNLPQSETAENRPDLRIGTLAMFGVVEASGADDRHPDTGLGFTFEASDVCARLVAARDWHAQTLRVTFVPSPWDGPINVRVGRVSLYFE